MDMRPSAHQQELRDRAYELAAKRFAPRAAEYDREAAFPIEDYADLRTSGLLALGVPEQYGGLGADFETYCLVAEQLARGNASTALTYNMHANTMLMMGPLIKDLELPPEVLQSYREVLLEVHRSRRGGGRPDPHFYEYFTSEGTEAMPVYRLRR